MKPQAITRRTVSRPASILPNPEPRRYHPSFLKKLAFDPDLLDRLCDRQLSDEVHEEVILLITPDLNVLRFEEHRDSIDL